MLRHRDIAPSFQSGFARSPGESAAPELWPIHAWVPALGGQGGVLHDIARSVRGVNTGTYSWTSVGIDSPASTFEAEGIAGDLPTAATASWSIVAVAQFDAFVSLANIFGFGSQLPSTGGVGGSCRYLIEYLSNYYMWGQTADWNTGIAVDADGKTHVLAMTCDGVYLRFYRDGKLAAGPQARPTYTTAGSYITAASKHSSALSSFDGRFLAGYIYGASLPTPSVAELSRDFLLPFRLRRRVVGRVPTGVTNHAIAATGISSAATIGGLATALDHPLAITGISSAATIGGLATAINHPAALAGISSAATIGGLATALDHPLSITGVSSAGTIGGLATALDHPVSLTGVSSAGTIGGLASALDHALSITGISSAATIGSFSNLTDADVFIDIDAVFVRSISLDAQFVRAVDISTEFIRSINLEARV